MEQCIGRELVSGRLAATDSAHVKTNASPASEHLVEVAEKPGAYWERLDAYEEEVLDDLERKTRAGKTGRKRRQKDGAGRSPPSVRPELGQPHRPGVGTPEPSRKAKGSHDLSHQTTDCDLPLFHRVLRDHGIRFYVRPMPRSPSALSGVPGSPFTYDAENDLYTCPDGKALHRRNLIAAPADCTGCILRAGATAPPVP